MKKYFTYSFIFNSFFLLVIILTKLFFFIYYATIIKIKKVHLIKFLIIIYSYF